MLLSRWTVGTKCNSGGFGHSRHTYTLAHARNAAAYGCLPALGDIPALGHSPLYLEKKSCNMK